MGASKAYQSRHPPTHPPTPGGSCFAAITTAKTVVALGTGSEGGGSCKLKQPFFRRHPQQGRPGISELAEAAGRRQPLCPQPGQQGPCPPVTPFV